MASYSKSSAHNLEHGSDCVYDHVCLSCSEEDRTIEANHFCEDCDQCFCDGCIRLHNKLHKRHVVLGQRDVDKWTSAATAVSPYVYRCDKHPDEYLKLECIDHRQLCCHVCICLHHK